LETGWRARKEGDRHRRPDAELSSGMDVGKELKLKWGMRKRSVPERQSKRHQERVGMQAGGRGQMDGRGLEQDGRLTERLLPTVR
jgi:hypothetical protein